jgi:hypothetical protein
MDIKNNLKDLSLSIEKFLNALLHYETAEFQAQHDPESWSIGHMYGHLIHGTRNYHLSQLKECMQSSENHNQSLSEDGIKILKANAFPPIRIKVPAGSNSGYQPPQMTITDAQAEMQKLLDELKTVAAQLENVASGKTQHIRFGYLDAAEWFQLIAIHFHHHFLQLNRLHDFLGKKISL